MIPRLVHKIEEGYPERDGGAEEEGQGWGDSRRLIYLYLRSVRFCSSALLWVKLKKHWGKCQFVTISWLLRKKYLKQLSAIFFILGLVEAQAYELISLTFSRTNIFLKCKYFKVPLCSPLMSFCRSFTGLGVDFICGWEILEFIKDPFLGSLLVQLVKDTPVLNNN